MSIPASVLSRPEHRLLLLCACRVHAPQSKQKWLKLLQEPLDWDYLLPRLQSNGMLGLFSHHGQVQEALLPDRAKRVLQFEFNQELQRRLLMLAELRQLVEFLSAQDVRVLAYKGPTLAHIAYGSVALRPFSDLDLLIDPQQKAQTISLLKSNGYLPESEEVLPAEIEEKGQLRSYETTFLPTQGVGALDVHWAVAPPYEAFPLHFEALWERRIASDLMPSVRTFCREDLICYLCSHGAKHRWLRLEWIGCLLGILQNAAEKPLNWEQIEAAANTLNSRRTLHLGLQLAFDLAQNEPQTSAIVHQSIPEKMRRAVAADAGAARLSRQTWDTLFQQENPHDDAFITLTALLFALRVRDNHKARVRYFWAIHHAFLVPTAEETAEKRGHKAMYLVRFQRLIMRRLHRLVVLRRF